MVLSMFGLTEVKVDMVVPIVLGHNLPLCFGTEYSAKIVDN